MAGKEKNRQYSAQELSVFCSEVALVLHSGMFLPDGIAAMANESGSRVLAGMKTAVEGGESLAAALGGAGMFPDYMVNMVAVGEEAGKLEQVMGSLASFYEREHAVRSRIRSAVFYPMALVSMMIIVIGVLLIRVLPVFADVFADLGGAAGAVSPDMVSFSTVAGYIALALAALMLVLCAVTAVKLRSAAGYAQLMRILAKLGITRKLAAKIGTGRFAFALSMMLESGYGIDAALEKLPEIVENDEVAKRIGECRKAMAGGASFSHAVEQAGIFTGMYAEILGVGFRAGALDSVTARIADIYEEEIDAETNRMVGAAEPVLVAILCVVIGVILLCVMLPLMEIMTSIG